MAQATIGRISSKKIGPWKGMNERVSPDTLPPDVLANIQNALLDETPGTVVKRQGMRKLTGLPSGLPPRDTYVFTKLDGTSYLLISDGVNLYYTTDPSGAYPAAIKAGLNPDGFMAFETAENKVWMSNGIDGVMSWDGTTLINLERTRTVTNASSAVTATTITNADLTEADSYWVGQKLVFTSGANIGTVVTVTAFVAATDTLTFTPAVAGIAVGDDFIVGVSIPKAAALRYWDGHLFAGCTADNNAELRFSEISDPDTGAVMTIDNPRAWPAANELALNVLDREKLHGITPVLRDRIMAHKATGLFRLERDPLVRYRLEAVSRSVGSRFPDTWAEKNNLLYFLGQDKDGLPEVYKTDMVDVSLVDPDGGVEPTLRGLQQPNAVASQQTFTSSDDFDAGTKSTLAATLSGQLGVGAFDSSSKWIDNLVSAANIDLETTPGVPALLGVPVWDVRYEADVLPAAASPAWTAAVGSNGSFPTASSQSVAAGALSIGAGPTYAGGYYYYRQNIFDATKDTLMTIKIGGTSFLFGVYNGSKGVLFAKQGTGGLTVFTSGGSGGAIISPGTGYHVYTVLLKSTGAYKLWADGVLVNSGTGGATTTNEAVFGMGSPTSLSSWSGASVGQAVAVDYVYYHADFKGDGLSSQGNKVLPLAMPDTLPTTGNIVVLNDLTRTPDALRRVYAASTLYGGTAAVESWTSSTVDFTAGNDAGYVAVANGAVPTSAVKRAQRLKLTLTAADGGNAPVVTALYSGMKWLSPPVDLGSNIAAWRTLLATVTKPVGTDQAIKIRRATVTTAPIESDWGAEFVIVNGDNIGTVLTDVVPTSRWVQLDVEQGVSAAGLLPYIDAAVVQWTDGSPGNLPVRAVVHKKRYWIAAATATAAANDIIVVADRNDQWTKFAGLAMNALIHFKGNLYGADAGTAKMAHLDVAGVYNDDGAAIDAFIETREEDAGAGHLRKDFRYSYLEWDRAAAAWTMTTSYKRSGEAAYTGSGTFNFGTDGADVRQNYPVGTVGKRIQRKYRNAVLDESMAFTGEMLYFTVRGVQP
jgi:hypothetical protein